MKLNVVTLFLAVHFNCGNSLKCFSCSDKSCNPREIKTIACSESTTSKCYLVSWKLKGKTREMRGCIGDMIAKLLGPKLKECGLNDTNTNAGGLSDVNIDLINKITTGTTCILCATDECNQAEKKSKDSKEKSGAGSSAYTLYYLTSFLVLFVTL
nr:PREDICTED: uncharacterized protein LOC103313219 [Tribolium castaneum]|eukprot:XP_015835904.1 PREDICTED: uncharacterized protein LOC103313219 [Tribolium castaneum]